MATCHAFRGAPRALGLMMTALLLAGPAAGLALAAPLPGPVATLQVKAFVDGRSILHITADPTGADTKVYWHHKDWNAPGRWNGNFHPTRFNGVPWQPTWPFGNGGGLFCDCVSDPRSLTDLAIDDIVAAGAGLTPQQLANDLSVVGFAAANTRGLSATVTFSQCRGICSVTRAGDDLVITLNDNAPGGAAWYIVDIALQ